MGFGAAFPAGAGDAGEASLRPPRVLTRENPFA